MRQRRANKKKNVEHFAFIPQFRIPGSLSGMETLNVLTVPARYPDSVSACGPSSLPGRAAERSGGGGGTHISKASALQPPSVSWPAGTRAFAYSALKPWCVMHSSGPVPNRKGGAVLVWSMCHAYTPRAPVQPGSQLLSGFAGEGQCGGHYPAGRGQHASSRSTHQTTLACQSARAKCRAG